MEEIQINMEPLFSKDPNDLLEEKMMDNIETARESLCRNNTFSNMDGSVEQRVCLEESSCYATSDFETTEKEEVNSIDNYKDVFTVKPESLTNFPENKTTTKLTFNPEDLDDAIMKEESVEVTGKVKQIQSQETKQTNEAEFMLEALPNACLILLSKVEPMEEKFFYAEGSSYSPCRLKKKKIEPCRVILGDYSLSEFQKCSETFRSVVPKEEFTAHKEELKEFKLEFPQKETKESNQMEVELEVAYDAGKVLAKKVEAEEEKFRAEECSLFTCPTTKYESGVVKMDPIKELPKSGCIHNFRKDLKKVDIISTKNEKLVDTEELKQVKPGFPEEETKASNQMEFKVEPASGPSTGFVNQVEPVVERATLQKRSSRCVTWKCENFHSMKTEPCFDLQENESVSKVWRNSERIIDKIEKEESVVQTEEFEPLKSDYPQDKIEASDQIELAQEVVSEHEKVSTGSSREQYQLLSSSTTTKTSLISEKQMHKHDVYSTCSTDCEDLEENENINMEGKLIASDMKGKKVGQKRKLQYRKINHTRMEKLRCRICGAMFTRKKNFKKHQLLHSREQLTVCNKKFAEKRQLNEHLLLHSGEKTFVCECGKVFLQEANLKQHQYLHTIAESFRCNVCGKTFLEKEYLDTHRLTHTCRKIYRCNVCGKSFLCYQYLRDHRMIHTDVRPFGCDICGKRFMKHEQLKCHLSTHSIKKNFLCDVCGKGFASIYAIQKHLFLHTEEKPFSCDKCDETFKRNRDLKSHYFVHTGEVPHRCKICGRSFRWSFNLKKHYLVHNDERLFKCDLCEKSFKRKCHLRQHQLTHSDECHFSCDICEKRFKKKGGLTKHQMIHSGEKPFVCDICGKRFGDNGNLKRHKLIHK